MTPVDSLNSFDTAYGAAVLSSAARAQRAVVILDPSDVEDLIREAVDSDLWAEASADPAPEQLLGIARHEHTPALQVTEGAGLSAFDTLLEGDAFAIESVVAALRPPHPQASVLVGGFARSDCVRRAATALAAGGWKVSLCEHTTLPLDRRGLAAYSSRTSG